MNLINCSRGIRNAWQLHYALVLVVKVVCSNLGIALLSTQRGVMYFKQ
ncbi:DUF3265 domain-containing protein [Vibrio sp. T3Y01]|nr:DUF3265 domain-containing protein [Vibrio sp. T3Y01]PQJ56169.1 hypothetical protein BTO12_01055 [Vibrio splendidus]